MPYLGSFSEESSGVSLLLGLASCEHSIIDLANIGSLNIDNSASGHGVGLVDSLERDSVDLVGSSNKEQSRLKLFHENNSLSSESSS